MPSVPIFIEAEIGNKPVAKVVAKVFDNFNNLKSGSLSVDNFQDIVDALAKGFGRGAGYADKISPSRQHWPHSF
jgi:hypothetical protein